MVVMHDCLDYLRLHALLAGSGKRKRERYHSIELTINKYTKRLHPL
jgi:hypothetical protein